VRLTLSISGWPEGNVIPTHFETEVRDQTWSGILIGRAWWIPLGAVCLFGVWWMASRKIRLAKLTGAK
jgi:hypothetical protein